MSNVIPQGIYDALKKLYPEIERKMTVEEVMTLVQANEAITKADTTAYKAVMDSAYGAPKQDLTSDGKPLPTPVIQIIAPKQ